MWAVGVTAYIVLSGTPPFWNDHQTEALVKILTASYDFDLVRIPRGGGMDECLRSLACVE